MKSILKRSVNVMRSSEFDKSKYCQLLFFRPSRLSTLARNNILNEGLEPHALFYTKTMLLLNSFFSYLVELALMLSSMTHWKKSKSIGHSSMRGTPGELEKMSYRKLLSVRSEILLVDNLRIVPAKCYL